jgi:serine protease inhibitor
MLLHLPPTRRPLTSVGTAVLGLSLLALNLTACGSETADDGPDPRTDGGAVLQSQVAQQAPDESTDLTDAVEGLRGLGHDLSTHLPAESGSGGNQVFSPASLAIAFAMLREGAGRASGDEIDDVIGLPENRQAAYNRIVTALTDVGDGDRLEINDAIFLDPGFDVRQPYLDAIQRWYGAGLHQTAFPSPALDDINGWVDDKTHGRIPRLLDQLDPAAVFALVNTIYLNAKWERPFDPGDTSSADFTTGTGDHISAKTMHNDTELDLVRGEGWRAVRLPYAGGKLSMWVLLPDRGGDPKQLLRPELLGGLSHAARPTMVELSLPRWDTETNADLVPVLQDLGMRQTFGTGQYPGVTKDPRFVVSDVIQQANITVGEKGTVAAAATAIVGEVSAMPPQGVDFTADHPFAFAIVHDETGVPLFEGVVSDPSAG